MCMHESLIKIKPYKHNDISCDAYLYARMNVPGIHPWFMLTLYILQVQGHSRSKRVHYIDHGVTNNVYLLFKIRLMCNISLKWM